MPSRTFWFLLTFAGSAAISPFAKAAIADGSVTISGPATVFAGDTATYQITATNHGPAAITGPELLVTGPGLVISATQVSGPPFTLHDFFPVMFSASTMPAGASATFTVVLKIDPSTAPGSLATTTAGFYVVVDTDPVNNNVAVSTATVTAQSDLGIAKSTPAVATAGGGVTYVLNLNNAGPSDAQSVTLTDPLPSSVRFASVSQTAGPAFNCSSPPIGSNGTVSCSLATLPSGGEASFQVKGTIDPATPIGTVISNSASVSSATTDTAGGNNSASASTSINAQIPTLSASALAALAVVFGAIAAIALKA
jgi:uncharacterized repeat protein (TIGR01451 family)